MNWSELFDYPETEHKTRVMCGDPKALAYEWIKGYVANLNAGGYEEDGYEESITIEELIDAALENIEGDSQWPSEYINKGSLLGGKYVEDMFWDKLAIIKDIEIPSSKRNNFFSCSC